MFNSSLFMFRENRCVFRELTPAESESNSLASERHAIDEAHRYCSLTGSDVTKLISSLMGEHNSQLTQYQNTEGDEFLIEVALTTALHHLRQVARFTKKSVQDVIYDFGSKFQLENA